MEKVPGKLRVIRDSIGCRKWALLLHLAGNGVKDILNTLPKLVSICFKVLYFTSIVTIDIDLCIYYLFDFVLDVYIFIVLVNIQESEW